MLTAKTYFLTLFLATSLTKCCQSAEILVVNPMPSYSHFTIPFKLAKELAHRGHHVTCINAYPQRTKIENYEDVSVVENIPLIEEEMKKLFKRQSVSILENLTSLFDLMAAITNATIHHKNVRKLLESEKKFDVVIVENFFNEALVGFGHHFKAPVILISTQGASAMNNFIFANPAPLSYVPGTASGVTKHMNFWQRIKNLVMVGVFTSLVHFYHLPQQNKIFKTYIQDADFDDVLYNTSLLLSNSHNSVSNPNPLVPSIIEIAGFHVTPKPLPEDIKQFLDKAEDGVVLFSMGSNLKSEDLKPETREGILKAFGKLKQKVLWKFETELPNTPENVKIMHWLPQQDILGHPNVRAFITHGGRLGTIEAVYFGVPFIGIPVFGDQLSNVATAVSDGYGVSIAMDDLSEETLSQALNEILTNPKYKENAQHRSKLMHDQPLKPLDAAVFWVEHVIRHQGAPHLRSAGLDLKWYQRELIDVIAFLILVVVLFLTVIFVSVKKLFRFVFGRKVVPKSKKNQ